MKHIYLNLKRFDVPAQYGGVNRIAPIEKWAEHIVTSTQEALKKYGADEVEFVQFYPEAHLLAARAALCEGSPLHIGCQGVYRENISEGGNFGAFTTNRPVAAMRAMGVESALIGHCEERFDKLGMLSLASVSDSGAVNALLRREVALCVENGMSVLYCIGEKSEETDRWQEVLREQLERGLEGVDAGSVVVGYEPIWSIGPGKKPADREYITKVARFIKEVCPGVDVVYGGGLKVDNAEMLASIPEIDGGLIALTRFTGEVGFYPDEYLNIIRAYMGG